MQEIPAFFSLFQYFKDRFTPVLSAECGTMIYLFFYSFKSPFGLIYVICFICLICVICEPLGDFLDVFVYF